jgi:hypothetical protein
MGSPKLKSVPPLALPPVVTSLMVSPLTTPSNLVDEAIAREDK